MGNPTLKAEWHHPVGCDPVLSRRENVNWVPNLSYFASQLQMQCYQTPYVPVAMPSQPSVWRQTKLFTP